MYSHNKSEIGLSRIKVEGFTTVELVIAMLVVVILASIALPAYQKHVATTELNKCYNFLNSSRLVADNLVQLNGGAADSIAAADLGFPVNSTDCDAGLTVADADTDGNITLRGSANVSAHSSAVVLSLVRSGASGTWSCSSNAPSLGITPSFCP